MESTYVRRSKRSRAPIDTALKRQVKAAKSGWRLKFLKALAETGIPNQAANAAGISRSTAYRNREKSAAFARLWDAAVESAIEIAEAELRRRAVEGTVKPVFGPLGPKQGSGIIGSIREYDTTALIFYLKAHRPEKYRERGHLIIEREGSEVDAAIQELSKEIAALAKKADVPAE